MFEGKLYFMIDRVYDEDSGLPDYISGLEQELEEANGEYVSIKQEISRMLKKKGKTYEDKEELDQLQSGLNYTKEWITETKKELRKAIRERKELTKKIDEHLEKYLSQKNLTRAISSGHEIMIATDYYYMVPMVHVDSDRNVTETGPKLLDKLHKRLKAKK